MQLARAAVIFIIKMNVEPDEFLGGGRAGGNQEDQGAPSSVLEPGGTGPASASDPCSDLPTPPTDATDTCSHHEQHQNDDDCSLPSSPQHQHEKDTTELGPSSKPSLETERVAELLLEAEMVVGGASEHMPGTDDTDAEDVCPGIEIPGKNENENTSRNDDTSANSHCRSSENSGENPSKSEEGGREEEVPPPPQSPTPLPSVEADEAQTNAVTEGNDDKQDGVGETSVPVAAAACYPSVANILFKGRDDDDGDGGAKALASETSAAFGETMKKEAVEVPPLVPETATADVGLDAETHVDRVSVSSERDRTYIDDENEETMGGEDVDMEACRVPVCDQSAETLPMMDGDNTSDHDAGVNEASSSVAVMGLPFLSPGTKMVQRAVIESMAVADTDAAEAEEVKEEDDIDIDILATNDSSMTEILSPETRIVHQKLVEGCTTDINSTSESGVVDEDAEVESEQVHVGGDAAAAIIDDDASFGADSHQSNEIMIVATPDQRNASMNSVYTDDGMGAELNNLNTIENEIRREVESPHVEIKAAAASPRRVRAAATAFVDGDTPSRRGSVDASSNGGSGISASSTFGGAEATNINNALEQLQEQVGAMAREALLSQDSDDEFDSPFVPLGADPKPMSFMSDADDGLDEELRNLSDAENEIRKEMEGAQMVDREMRKESEQKESIEEEVVKGMSPPINESSADHSDLPVKTMDRSAASVVADETVLSSPITTALHEEEEREEEGPATSSLMASPTTFGVSQPTLPPKLSFQECIELERWDSVRTMLDADHGKVARQDVYIINDDSASDPGDDEDEVDCIDDSTEGADTRHRRRATPLHLACTRDPPLDVVKSLIDANPEAVASPTRLGWEYPLHYAIGSGMASDSVINALTEAYPDAVAQVSTGAARFGVHRSPLHLAVVAFLQDDDDAFPSISVLRNMCRRNPASRKVRDGSGRTPLELAGAIQHPTACPQDLKKILLPSNDINEMIVFRVKSLLLAILVVGAAWFLKKLEHFGASMVDRAEESFAEVVSMGSSGLAVAFCICIIALLVVNTTRIIQQDKAQHRLGEDEDDSASDELVTILYVSAVGLIVLFATEPVTLLLHTTIVTGCALGYILLRRSKKGPIDENANSEFLDCREIHGSMSDSSLKDREYDRTPLERDGMCIVCWERPADHVLVPCGHLCLCAECPRHLGDDLNWQCPIGKCSVHAAMKVFPAQIKRSDDDDDFDVEGDDDALQDCERVGAVPTHDDDSNI